MKTPVAILLILLALILVSECTPRKGKYNYGHYRRRYYCSPYRKRDCWVTTWSAWCHCSHDCGSSGLRSRTRHIIRPEQCGGKPCPSLREKEPCNRMCHNGGIPQPGHCKCLPGYSGKCCEKGNGQGTTGFCSGKSDGVYPYPKDCSKFYHCSNGITHIKDCPANLRWNAKAKVCDWPQNVPCGQVKGGWSAWGKWNICSKRCDGGYQLRTRFCNNPKPHPENDQTKCVGHNIESRKCNTQSCSVQGGWSTWSKWNTCSQTCGGGYQIRVRHCNNPKPHPVNDQTECKGDRLQSRKCNTQSCSGSCSWDKWGKWSKCSASCGCGSHKRTRHCKCNHGNGYKKRGYYGSRCYGDSVEHGKCNCHKCPGPHVKIAPIGCFKDTFNRALPNFLANFYGETTPLHRIEGCAHVANKFKVKFFGMQDGGECWVDLKGVNHYDKHGKSSNCKSGIGGGWTNFVYKIIT